MSAGSLRRAIAGARAPELVDGLFAYLGGCRRWALLWKRNRTGNCRLVAIARGFLNLLPRPPILSCLPKSLCYVLVGVDQQRLAYRLPALVLRSTETLLL